MFSTSVIRKLAPSEEMFAQSQTFFACTVHLRGPVDVEALGLAFDMLLQAHPVLAGHLDKRPDGLHDIVVDDLVHPGIWVADVDETALEVHLDQGAALANLRLKVGEGLADLTLYTHHCLTDAQHHLALLCELFTFYADAVGSGHVEAVFAQPAPEPLETVLESRGVRRQSRSGFERLMDSYEAEHFAYDEGARRVADSTLALMRTFYAKPVQKPAGIFAKAIMDQPLREAFRYDAPPAVVQRLSRTGLRARGVLLRAFPARRNPKRIEDISWIRSYPNGYVLEQLGTFPDSDRGQAQAKA